MISENDYFSSYPSPTRSLMNNYKEIDRTSKAGTGLNYNDDKSYFPMPFQNSKTSNRSIE